MHINYSSLIVFCGAELHFRDSPNGAKGCKGFIGLSRPPKEGFSPHNEPPCGAEPPDALFTVFYYQEDF